MSVPPNARRRAIVLAAASAVLLALFLYGLGTFSSSGTSSTSQPKGSSSESTTSYGALASSVLSAAAEYAPSGYSQGASKVLFPNETGLVSAAYSLFSNQGGALANVTIVVFGTQGAANRYAESVIANAKGLSGYTNVNSTLAGFQHYGVCYGYAEGDPEGNEFVANGLCTKGNVYIQVHVAATSSLDATEGDMSGFVDAAYQALG